MPVLQGETRFVFPDGTVLSMPATLHYPTPEQIAEDAAKWEAHKAERERRTWRARWARFCAWLPLDRLPKGKA